MKKFKWCQVFLLDVWKAPAETVPLKEISQQGFVFGMRKIPKLNSWIYSSMIITWREVSCHFFLTFRKFDSITNKFKMIRRLPRSFNAQAFTILIKTIHNIWILRICLVNGKHVFQLFHFYLDTSVCVVETKCKKCKVITSVLEINCCTKHLKVLM